MAASSDFLAFATAPDANVTSQEDWIGDPVVPEGFTSGILPSPQTNKAIRQASFIAAGVAQVVSSTLGVDVNDDGNLGYFAAQLASAISSLGGGEGSAGAVNEAPYDGFYYARGNNLWQRALRLAGGTLTGQLVLAADPVVPLGAATKQYVDTGAALAISSVQRGGDTMTGPLILSANPTAALGAATKQYVDTRTPVPLTVAGGGTGVVTFPPPRLYAAGSTDVLGAFPMVKGTGAFAVSRWATYTNGTTPFPNSFVCNGATGDPAQFPWMELCTSGGTIAAPTATPLNQLMGGIYFGGYDGAGWTDRGAIEAFATQTWSLTGRGTAIRISATPNASTAYHLEIQFGPSGVMVGNPTAPAGGLQVGDLNAQRLLVQGGAIPVSMGGTGTNNLPLPPTGVGTAAGVVPFANGTGPFIASQWWMWTGFPTSLIAYGARNDYGDPWITMGQAGGTISAPTNTPYDVTLGGVYFDGYGGGAWRSSKAYMAARAAENWSGTANGANLIFGTTLNGTTVGRAVLTLYHNSSAVLGGTLTVASDIGSGDAAIELGQGRTLSGNAYLDFHTNPGSDFDFRIYRNPGVNGDASLVNAGNGPLRIAGIGCVEIDPFGGNDARIRMGYPRTADGHGYIDFFCATTSTIGPGYYNMRLIRETGVHGAAILQQSGNAPLILYAESGVHLRNGVGGAYWANFNETRHNIFPSTFYRAGFNDPLTVQCDVGNYARIVYAQGYRTWTCGADTGQDFIIADETALSYRMTIRASDGWLRVFVNAMKPGGGAWVDSSDLRIKHDVVPYQVGLAEVTQLSPVRYRHNGKGGTVDDGRVFTGLVADDVREIMPEMVGTMLQRLDPEDSDEIELLTLDSTPLTFALINCCKELAARVRALEEKHGA